MKHMNRTSIEWADYTWNPIVGCRRGCSYCYAKRINDRFNFIPDFTDPQFIPERLKVTGKIAMPRKRNRIVRHLSPDRPVVFVGSMAEMLDDCNPDQWLIKVLTFMESHPEALFVLLSKQMDIHVHLTSYSVKNLMIGLTLDKQDHMSFEKANSLAILKSMQSNVDIFLNYEPLLKFDGAPFAIDTIQQKCKFIVVGAMTGNYAVKTKMEDVDALQGVANNHSIPVYYKDNLFKDYPFLERETADQTNA